MRKAVCRSPIDAEGRFAHGLAVCCGSGDAEIDVAGDGGERRAVGGARCSVSLGDAAASPQKYYALLQLFIAPVELSSTADASLPKMLR